MLWADRFTAKDSIGISPYQLVYGIHVVFPTFLRIPFLKMMQELEVEPNDLQRRINQTVHFHQTREAVHNKNHLIRDNINKKFE